MDSDMTIDEFVSVLDDHMVEIGDYVTVDLRHPPRTTRMIFRGIREGSHGDFQVLVGDIEDLRTIDVHPSCIVDWKSFYEELMG